MFAYCTNTLGNYFCSCREGYTGDGHKCTDIDECADPVLASRCVRNAECCNLPAHFVCKCQPGFEGDGEVECRGKNTFCSVIILFFVSFFCATYFHFPITHASRSCSEEVSWLNGMIRSFFNICHQHFNSIIAYSTNTSSFNAPKK